MAKAAAAEAAAEEVRPSWYHRRPPVDQNRRRAIFLPGLVGIVDTKGERYGQELADEALVRCEIVRLAKVYRERPL